MTPAIDLAVSVQIDHAPSPHPSAMHARVSQPPTHPTATQPTHLEVCAASRVMGMPSRNSITIMRSVTSPGML